MGQSLVAGVDIGHHSIKAVLLKPHRESYSLLGCQEIVVPDDIFADNHTLNYQKIVKKLKELKKGLPLFSRKVALAVPDSSVITKQIQIDSALDANEQEFAVYQAFAQQSPMPLDALQLDYIMQSDSLSAEGKQEGQVYATRSEVVQSRVDALRGAGWQPLQLALLSQVMRGLWCWYSVQQGRSDCLLVDVGQRWLTLTMQLPDGTFYYRQQSFTQTPALTFPAMSSVAGVVADDMLFDCLQRELQRLSALHGSDVVAGLWLCGGGAEQLLSNPLATGLPCELLSAFDGLERTGCASPAEKPHCYALAMALALSGLRWQQQLLSGAVR